MGIISEKKLKKELEQSLAILQQIIQWGREVIAAIQVMTAIEMGVLEKLLVIVDTALKIPSKSENKQLNQALVETTIDKDLSRNTQNLKNFQPEVAVKDQKIPQTVSIPALAAKSLTSVLNSHLEKRNELLDSNLLENKKGTPVDKVDKHSKTNDEKEDELPYNNHGI